MKTVVVTQHGEGEHEYVRKCVVQIPDDFPLEAIENEVVERCLNDEDVSWEINYEGRISAIRCDIERIGSERNMMGRPFIEYPSDAISDADE